jgi:hypothetical protein
MIKYPKHNNDNVIVALAWFHFVPKLSMSEIRILSCILGSNEEEKNVEFIEHKIQMNKKTVQNTLSNLRKKGYLNAFSETDKLEKEFNKASEKLEKIQDRL